MTDTTPIVKMKVGCHPAGDAPRPVTTGLGGQSGRGQSRRRDPWFAWSATSPDVVMCLDIEVSMSSPRRVSGSSNWQEVYEPGRWPTSSDGDAVRCVSKSTLPDGQDAFKRLRADTRQLEAGV